MKALEIKNLKKNYGDFPVLKDIDFSVEEGERRAVIGPNGAGKTTLFNIVSGFTKPDRGEIRFFGKDIKGMAPYQRARLGMGRTFQKSNLFNNLSIEDHILLTSRHIKSAVNCNDLLDKAALAGRQKARAGELSYGEQRQLELLLVLAQSPKLVLLDEPTAGMSAVETGKIIRMLADFPPDITLLLIEHDMDVVFNLANRITVLQSGRIKSEGDRITVRSDPAVRQAYLGMEFTEGSGDG